MTHFEFSAAVHAIAREAGAIDSHTSECCTVECNGGGRVYYYAQIWFSRGTKPHDVVSASDPDVGVLLRELRDGIRNRATVRNLEAAPC